VLCGVVFCCFFYVMSSVKVMPVRGMGMVAALFVITGFMVFGCLAMMLCRMLVVLRRLVVMLSPFVFSR
jgi:hypothetical protein